jgi:hypothetical protein
MPPATTFVGDKCVKSIVSSVKKTLAIFPTILATGPALCVPMFMVGVVASKPLPLMVNVNASDGNVAECVITVGVVASSNATVRASDDHVPDTVTTP